MPLEVAERSNGRIVVADGSDGHRFAFRLATAKGQQVLEALRPEWAGGEEPTQAHGLTIRARELAEREAREQGWIVGHDPEVG